MKARTRVALAGIILLIVATAVISLVMMAAGAPPAAPIPPVRAPRPSLVPAPEAVEVERPARQAPGAAAAAQPVPRPAPSPYGPEVGGSAGPLVAGALLPLVLALGSLGLLLVVTRANRWRRSVPQPGPGDLRTPSSSLLPTHLSSSWPAAGLLLLLLLAGCRSPAPDPLPPDQYLDNALNWLEANAVTAGDVDWESVRAEAIALAPEPQTTVDTYPAIRYALAQLDDPLTWLHTPDQDAFEPVALGLTAIYPENIIVAIENDSPAARADIQVGDRVLQIGGAPPAPDPRRPNTVDFPVDRTEKPAPLSILLRRDGREIEVTLTPVRYTNEDPPTGRAFDLGGRQAAYLELRTDVGTRMYPTWTQAEMQAAEGADTCGWIIDLRRNRGGDLWTYFAALGPLLGEGQLGGFEYADGSREEWRYEDGQVFWAGEERHESFVRGRIYQLENASPPVALLVSPLTEAAGELVVVAFQGWGTVRTFGETTLGVPHLVLHTPLSDGAQLFASGARGVDRNGIVYNGPIVPDEQVPTDWQQFGGTDDPVISAALEWLSTLPACTS